MQPRHIDRDIAINAAPEKLWEILSHYGDVSSFHSGVVASHREGNSANTAAPGCERVCHIVDMGLPITLKERIVDYEEGRSYAYEVYEWKNFPIREMRFGFTIVETGNAQVRLRIDIHYLAKPALLTPLLAGKMRRLAGDVLLGYKHYAETGQRRVPIRELKQRYPANGGIRMQYG